MQAATSCLRCRKTGNAGRCAWQCWKKHTGTECPATPCEKRTSFSIRLLRIAAVVHELLEPRLCLLLAKLAGARDSGLERFLDAGRRHSRATHVEETSLFKQIVGDQLRLLPHLVRDKYHLWRIMRLVELECTNKRSKYTLALVQGPVLLVKQLFLFPAAAIEHDHRTCLDALLFLVELVLAKGTDRCDAPM